MPLQEIVAGDDKLLQEVADVILRSHKIVLITGAGISTSCGIPDFRSKDGLYNLIPEQSIFPTPPPSEPSTPSRKRKAYTTDDEDFSSSSQASNSSATSRRSSGASSKLRGQDLFDSSLWKNPATTATFYQFIASLRRKIYEDVKEPSATHKFVRGLRDSGRLMRCYTQNIDGLEARETLCTDLSRGKGNKRRFMKKVFEAPLPEQTTNTDFDGGCEVVQLHGDLDKLRCTLCQDTCNWSDDATDDFLEGRAPECEKCSTKSTQRQAKGKRGLTVGSLRPNIVLYGEEHPSNTHLTPLVPFDIACEPEVLIIMGTSLRVFGLQKIVRDLAKAVHATKHGKGKVIFVNRTKPAESVWDGIIDDYVSMDCDNWVRDLNERRPDLSLRQSALDRKVTKPDTKRKRISADDGAEGKPAKKTKFMVQVPKIIKGLSKKTKVSSADKSLIEQQQGLPSNAMPLIRPTLTVPSAAEENSAHSTPRTDRHHKQFLPRANPPVVRDFSGTRPIATRSPLMRADAQSSSPGRPPYSPLTPQLSPFTPFSTRMSPKRPQFSPITPNTPARRMQKVFLEITENENAQEEVNVAESDQEKENGDVNVDAEVGLVMASKGIWEIKSTPAEEHSELKTTRPFYRRLFSSLRG